MLPQEDRYIWRVLSALKSGSADFDTMNVAVDRKTLGPEDRQRVAETAGAPACTVLPVRGGADRAGSDGANDDAGDSDSEEAAVGRLDAVAGPTAS